MVNNGGGSRSRSGPLSLRSLNHISLVCRSIEESIRFYGDILGFIPVKRPGSFGFDGAWLFNYGIGIHLLQSPNPVDVPKKTEINPRDNHISFQCDDVQEVERKLQEMNTKYVKRIVEEGGIYVDQLFLHDPDCYMIEICNCENLPVEPIVGSASSCNLELPSKPRNPSTCFQNKEICTQVQSTLMEQMILVSTSPRQKELAV
eukprot:PITA_09311